MKFALFMDDNGSVGVQKNTEYSFGEWDNANDITISVPGNVWAELGLFDEGRDGWESWDAEADLAAELFLVKLRMTGWIPDYDSIDEFQRNFRKLVCPGPPHRDILHVRLIKA